MVKLEKVNKYFNRRKRNEIHIINNTSIEFENTGLVALLGTSGSGKTTILNVIGGLDKVNKGKVYVNGKRITQKRTYKVDKIRNLNIGYIFQDYKLIDNLTVYENVAFAMYIVKATPRHIRRQVPMVLSLVGLSGKAKMYPNELSGGEQQRVALARALVNNPSMLIADEPTGDLDPDTAWDIMMLLNEINMRGTTVIVATHAKDIVDRMKKRVIQIDKGNIIRDDKKGGYDREV